MSAEYPGPDDEFVLMQRAAELVDGAADEFVSDMAYDELVPEIQAVHALGSAAAGKAITEMLASVEDNLAMAADPTGFADQVETDLAEGVTADQAGAYLRHLTPTTGVTLAKKSSTGTVEPDMPYRIALDTMRGNFAVLAADLPRPVDLTKRPKS